jgi:hypothetical protein
LEELETILWMWFKAHTANASIDGPQLKEKALHVAGRLGVSSFQVPYGWIVCYNKTHNLVYKTILGDSAIVNPETVIRMEKPVTAQNIQYLPAEGHI